MLSSKSLTELRGIAQSLDVPNVFQLDQVHLIQEITAKQIAAMPAPKVEIPRPEYDARLMNKPPSKRSNEEEIRQLLIPYVQRGLNLSFDEERWYMSSGKKTDEGTLRMPLKIVLRCAEKVMI